MELTDFPLLHKADLMRELMAGGEGRRGAYRRMA
jgi:hypothetical protein